MKKMGIALIALCLMMTAVLGVASVSAAEVMYGDVNGDGKVNNKDLAALQQYLADWDVEMDMDAADVTHDGKVNNKDLALLQQYLADWDVAIDTHVADVNDDGKVNNKDLALLQQYLADWDVVLK